MYNVFFFFKQKTAYEMRISDWSSDVCSSDLLAEGKATLPLIHAIRHTDAGTAAALRQAIAGGDTDALPTVLAALHATGGLEYSRSEERRAGKDGVSTFRSSWSPDHYNKKHTQININNTS